MAAVSFPVAVFWFEGWYDAISITPFGIAYRLACPKIRPALVSINPNRFRCAR